MIRCTNCQTENHPGSRFCIRCGAPLPQARPTRPLEADELPVAVRPTMPLDETAVPPPLEDLTPEQMPSDAGWEQDVSPLTLPFEPLPIGAFIGPYVVRQQITEEKEINHYFVTNEEETAVFILKESASWEPLRNEIEIVSRGINGEGLQPPLYAFQRRVGIMRYYLVLPPFGSLLGTLSVPIEPSKALNYGVGLARGLAHLHAQGIGFGKIDGRRVAIAGDEAYFFDFSGCVLPGNHIQYALEVQQLALILYMLLTGQRHFTAQNSLPTALQPLFAGLLGQPQPTTALELANELTRLAAQIRRPPSVDLRVGRQTDVGMLRQLNEDSLCTLEMVWNNQSENVPVGVYVVADGMGGHEGGEVASGLAIRAVMQLATSELLAAIARESVLDYAAWLKKAIEAANTAVYERSKQSRNDMGTTLVVVLVIGQEAHIAHVGDSRAYHLTQNAITQLTTDHSLVERLIATGQISREEARYHPQANVIYRTIGDKAKIEVDICTIHLEAGEWLLLCSDGLSGLVEDAQIHEIVTQATSPQSACATLVEAANAAGGDDNISVIIVQLKRLQ